MASNIWFVTGKGGVGRSVIAAALAKKQAGLGQRVLLAELGSRSFYSDFLSMDVEYQPKRCTGGFDVAIWDSKTALREYILHYFKLESIYRLIFDNQLARTFLNVAPSAAELAILGKITSGIRKSGPPLKYDLIVVDAFATGHFLSLIRGPIGILNALKYGPIAKESRGIMNVLSDEETSKFFIVAVAEELPIVESCELFKNIDADIGRKSKFLLNKCGPIWKPTDQETAADNKFCQFLETKKNLEAEAGTRLGQLSDVTQVPLISSHDPWKIIQGVSEAL